MAAPVLTIDLGALVRNWQALDRLSGDAETAAAVKADAYGCGIAPVAQALSNAGCQSFFVATLDEAATLHSVLPDARIFILNGVTGEECQVARNLGLRPCLNAPHQIAEWGAGGGGPCALQLDTGMSRLGVEPRDLDKMLQNPALPTALGGLELVMSHLACADDTNAGEAADMSARQRAAFETLTAALSAVLPPFKRSLAATGGTVLGRDYHYDLVRCGIGLYGGTPFAEAETVVHLTSPIIQIRDIEEGDAVGYGATWRAQRPSRIATLPLGYGDGLHRTLSDSGTVYINGQPAPVAGRVSMDLLTIDVTDHPDADKDTQVEIIGKTQSVDALATAAGTIGYEILTSLGTRYERRYKNAS